MPKEAQLTEALVVYIKRQQESLVSKVSTRGGDVFIRFGANATRETIRLVYYQIIPNTESPLFALRFTLMI